MNEHRLVLAVGLAAAVPVIVSTIRAVVDGWTPVFDEGVIAARSFDVFSTHSPLVGQYSELPSVGRLYDAGPLLYWLLAVQARTLGDWAMPVTMGVVNVAAIMGVVALARRRGGTVFMFATALATVVMLRAFPQGMLHEIDNSRAGVLPFLLLLFLAWSVACGEYRLLPLTVLVASFVSQAHFGLVPGAVAALAIAMAGLVWSHAGARRSDPEHARERRRWLIGALVVGLLCSSGPLLDEALHRPGNLVRMAQTVTAHQKTLGFGVGWHWLVWAIGLPPRWLGTWSGLEEFAKVYFTSTLANAASVLILAALLVLGMVALRRRRVDAAAAAALALVVSATIVLAGASLPTGGLVTRGAYALRWIAPAGMFAWLVLGWSVVVLRPTTWQAERLRRAARKIGRPAIASGSLLPLAGTAALAAAVATGPYVDANQSPWAYRPIGAVASVLTRRLPRQRSVLVVPGSFIAYTVQTAIIYRLRRAGYRVYAPLGIFDLAYRLGSYYVPDMPRSAPPSYDVVLSVDIGSAPASGHGRVIAVAPLHGAPSEFGVSNPTTLTLSIRPTTRLLRRPGR